MLYFTRHDKIRQCSNAIENHFIVAWQIVFYKKYINFFIEYKIVNCSQLMSLGVTNSRHFLMYAYKSFLNPAFGKEIIFSN